MALGLLGKKRMECFCWISPASHISGSLAFPVGERHQWQRGDVRRMVCRVAWCDLSHWNKPLGQSHSVSRCVAHRNLKDMKVYEDWPCACTAGGWDQGFTAQESQSHTGSDGNQRNDGPCADRIWRMLGCNVALGWAGCISPRFTVGKVC